MSMEPNFNLQELKDRIEVMTKYHQVEILRIFAAAHESHINENKNGTFVNLTEVTPNTLELVASYVKYVDEQTHELEEIESEKSQIQETFFKEDKDKRNIKLALA
jgi:hypothetical protein